MSRLIVYGDSYSTPDFCVNSQDSWWGLMATALQVDTVDNYSWPGNNVDSISHLIVAGSGFSKNDYVVVGIPPIERFTVYDTEGQPPRYHRFFGNLAPMDQPELGDHNGLRQVTTHQLGKKYVTAWNRSWQEAQVLRELFLLGRYINGWTSNYLFVNLAEPFQPKTDWSTLASIQRKFLANPHAVIFDDTYYSINQGIHRPVDFDTFGWHGHYGSDGNARWWNLVLQPKLKQLGWL
jgi:hypothetical protein